MKICKECKENKDLVEFSLASITNGKMYYRGFCKVCNAKKQKVCSAAKNAQEKYKSSQKCKDKRKERRQTESFKEGQRRYENERRLRDPIYKAKKNTRDRINKALKAKKWNKKSPFTQAIGCTREEFKSHLEAKFKEGMNWINYGFGKGKWCIDHVIPISSAKTQEQMYELSHFKNLQPLWFEENQKKSDKYHG